MWEVFKILLLCLISVLIATLTASWFYLCVIFIVLVILFHDFDFSVGVERHAISKLKHSVLKVRNLYTAIFESEQSTTNFEYTPTMNSINKQTSSFELSRFNKSGNVLSPINSGSSNGAGAFSSRRLIQSRQTSTPLTRTSPWQKNSLTPTNPPRNSVFHSTISNRSPRYALSSFTPKSDHSESPSKPTIQTVTGPLLASTRFNVNLGTYTDSKSPGLASRVVQYHNELSGNQTSTHQSKYGSPGQFPIVQLYKKDLPVLGRSSRRCTVRIAPPDPVPFNTEHVNTVLRDSFVQNNAENTNRQNDSEINTKSVLEALKEISRKRIHTNDDLDDISKRQRKNSISSSASNTILVNKDGKRIREDTPPKPKECTTLVLSAPKRICVVNEIESSLSSSRLMRMQQGQKRKSSINIPEINKQRRISNGELVSRETQTTVTNGSKSSDTNNKDPQTTTSTAAQTESDGGSGLLDVQLLFNDTRQKKKSSEFRTTRDIDEENSTLQFAKTSDFPKKSIFSEAPLEIMKENKLSVMLSALAGQEPEIIPLPDMTLSALKKKSKDNIDGCDVISKEVVSILSPKNKAKHDKHVTFAIPNSETSATTADIVLTSNETIGKNPVSESVTTSSNANNLTNIVSSSVPIMSTNFSSPITFGTPSAATTASNIIPFSSVTSPVSSALGGGIMFNSVSSYNTKANSITTTTDSVNVISSSTIEKSDSNKINFGSSTPNFNFGSNNTVKPPAFSSLVSSSKSEVNKPLAVPNTGFQFSSPSARPTSTAGSITFGSPLPVTTSSIAAPQPSIAFGSKSSAFSNTNIVPTTASTEISICSPNNQQSSSIMPVNIGFPVSSSAPTSSSTSGLFSFGPKTEAKSSTISSFAFGSVTSSQSPPKPGGFKFDLGNSSVNTNTPTKSEPPKTSMFGATGSSNLNKSGTFAFGTPVTTSATISFNATTTTGFSVTNSTTITPSFGASNKAATNMFGAPASTTANAGVFGSSTSTVATGMFGTPVTTTSNATFGAPGTTLTGGTFGTANTTAATFGTANTTAATFGTPSTTTNTGIFGSNSSSAFTAPKTAENPPAYGAFAASGSAPNAGFGTPTQNSNAFGFGTPTTQSNTFGNTPTTTSSSFSFGSTSATKPFSFGGTTTVTTTSSTMFGSTNTTTANLFGGNKSSSFGTVPGTATTFGTTTTTAQSTFGQPSSQQASNVFGAPSSSFGTGTSGSVFGSNNNNANAFGSSTPSNVFASPTPQASTFGTGTSTQANVFGMNNNSQPPQGNNVFGATNSNSSTFGPAANTSFGSGFNNNNAQSSSIGNFASPPAQAPGQSGVFTFGGAAQAAATPGTSNAFQFGAGSQTPKQSGFNFSANTNTPNINFGSGATTSFNATPAPAFGNSVPGQFNAPAPATGMFNIGSGSTAPKQRPIIKARRRN